MARVLPGVEERRQRGTVGHAASSVVVACAEGPLRRRVVDVLGTGGLDVVSEASDGHRAVDAVRRRRPHALVVDLALPVLDGMGVVRALTDRDGPTRTVMLMSPGEDALALMAMRLGADGYVVKGREHGLHGLADLIVRVVAGERDVSRRLTGQLVRRLRAVRGEGGGLRPVRSPLTDREWETLDLLCVGRSTAQIAGELFLSTETVRTHVKGILRKLDVRSRADAVEWAVRLREDLLGVEPPESPPVRNAGAGTPAT